MHVATAGKFLSLHGMRNPNEDGAHLQFANLSDIWEFLCAATRNNLNVSHVLILLATCFGITRLFFDKNAMHTFGRPIRMCS